jgi:hypothetical protein
VMEESRNWTVIKFENRTPKEEHERKDSTLWDFFPLPPITDTLLLQLINLEMLQILGVSFTVGTDI